MTDAIPPTMFDGIEPLAHLWVSLSGDDANDGSESAPIKTIQSALSRAQPGTAIEVKAGTYTENVRLANDGSADAPIWLRSSDGPHRAKIITADREKTVIGGFGVRNYIVEGFEIIGGRYGIQFNDASGTLCRNIVIRGNLIRECLSSGDGDGMKVSHTDRAWIIGNTIRDVQEEAIDILASNDVEVAYNEINGARSTAGGMFAKGGSMRVLIHHNLIRNAYADGMTIGGQTGLEYFRPDQNTFEAKDCGAEDNFIMGTGQNTINFKGAVNCWAKRNYCLGRNMISGVANILVMTGGPTGGPVFYSSGVVIADNIKAMNSKVQIQSGSTATVTNNDSTYRVLSHDEWTTQVGPSAIGLAPSGGASSAELDELQAQGDALTNELAAAQSSIAFANEEIGALIGKRDELRAALDAADALLKNIGAVSAAVSAYNGGASL